MARARELTWIKGAAGRSGRWRKKYRGKIYYFDGGRGKSDEDAYQAAITAWQAAKGNIDAAAPSPHYPAYQAAIRDWEDALTWSRDHGDEVMAATALQKLQQLRRDVQARRRKPPADGDLFQNHFVLKHRNHGMHKAMLELGEHAEMLFRRNLGIEPNANGDRKDLLDPAGLDMFAVDPLQKEGIEWRDRLNTMRREVPDEELTVRAQVTAFLKAQDSKLADGQLTAGRRNSVELHLNAFADWIGSSKAVGDISGKDLLDYRGHLLQQVAAQKWSRSTASDRLTSVKTFIRWLWRTEVLSVLPRIMDRGCQELEIGKSRTAIETFSKEEIGRLLKMATPRTQLYILLTLNTAMTQKDMSDLTFEEVEWSNQRITRKRSKTRKFDSAPVVSYKLWPETFALLSAEKHPSGKGRVLRNRNGSPLWSESMIASEKYRKTDNVRTAFERLRNTLDIRTPFKCLKKTSATELAGSKEYRTLRSVFLGHAPSTISDQHYAAAPTDLLDEAIMWLHKQFKIAELLAEEGSAV